MKRADARAIDEWSRCLGAEHVTSDSATLTEASTATFATTSRALAVIRPGDRDEVRECVRIARRHALTLHPISRGRSWGLGSRVPYRDAVIMDLARMSRVLEYDRTLGTVTLEPGVTFAQLAAFLEDSPFFVPVIGGPADSSVVANVLERGDRIGAAEDRLGCAAALEVVLPTGELIHTGLARFEGARAEGAHPWGVGPYLDGLFSQSGHGVVTRLTLALRARPNVHSVTRFVVPELGALASVVDGLRGLIQQRVLEPNAAGLWNAYKVLSVRGRYPWSIAPTPPMDLAALAGAEPWFGTASVYAHDADMAAAQVRAIEAGLEASGAVQIQSETLAGDALRTSLTLGMPSDINVASAYFRKRVDVHAPLDPDRDRCGFIWLCPVAPFVGEETVALLELAATRLREHGFEPSLGFGCISPRAIHVYIAIVYDRDESGEDERAMACHDALLEELAQAGHFPFRMGVQGGSRVLPAAEDDTEAFLERLALALDPDKPAPRAWLAGRKHEDEG